MAILDRHLDQLQHSRVVCIVEFVELRILAVNCQCVLRQVVRSYTEEIHLLRKLFAYHDSSRCLDHHTDLYILERNPLLS